MKPDYGNWIARPMMRTLWGITAALVLATLLCALLIGRDTAMSYLRTAAASCGASTAH